MVNSVINVIAEVDFSRPFNDELMNLLAENSPTEFDF